MQHYMIIQTKVVDLASDDAIQRGTQGSGNSVQGITIIKRTTGYPSRTWLNLNFNTFKIVGLVQTSAFNLTVWTSHFFSVHISFADMLFLQLFREATAGLLLVEESVQMGKRSFHCWCRTGCYSLQQNDMEWNIIE